MPELAIHLTKRADGGAVLRLVRADGSATWQRHDGHRGGFFPAHDLTHLAIETELGFRRGFYGLVAEGWSLEETEGKSARGPLPPETVTVEYLVGALDLERAGGVEWTAAEFNEHAARFADGRNLTVPALTDAELACVRARVRELLGRWGTLPRGGTLELTFDRPTPGPP